MDTEYYTKRRSAAKETKTKFMKGKSGRYFSVEEYDFINGIKFLFSAFELPQTDLVITMTSQYLRKNMCMVCLDNRPAV